ncbi:MAG: DUF1385 domain-containing protein [Oscillospiraceae bacterium]|jgi:uncharacterized protein YqhQ|nr:DUF1385 domain-containing protein [Oscillospiraceae bacterium]
MTGNDRKEKGKEGFRTSIGGQALIEGIMMLGPKKQAVAVRAGGEIRTKTEELKPLREKYPVLGAPFIRGVVNFGASMSRGVRALMYSANTAADGGGEADAEPEMGKAAVALAAAVGIALSIGLFMLLPTFLAGFAARLFDSRILKNLTEGAVRIAIFTAYIGLTSRVPDMRRVWMYHGAEHKAIFCYERGLELTVENVRAMPRRHPRCGTSFMFLVMLVSILVFSAVSWNGVLMRMGLRLLLLPVVVGVSYELVKWAGRHDNALTRAVSAPGKAMQSLTTKEPDDDMIEVAIAALTPVLPETEGEDEW